MTYEQFRQRYQFNPDTDVIGEGGFATVYKAYDTYCDMWVAIKKAEVKKQYENFRLKNEVELVNSLKHPNIAYYSECYSFALGSSTYDFAILQYYELGNLQQFSQKYDLSFKEKEEILFQLLEGIGFLHSESIIHCDLKPTNILIVDREGNFIPKITDFGISKKTTYEKSRYYDSFLKGGSLYFAVPEQIFSNELYPNSNIWSFGVIACWLFTGKLPFNTGKYDVNSTAGKKELLEQIRSGQLPDFIDDIPKRWCTIIRKSLQPNPYFRLKNVAECWEIIEDPSRFLTGVPGSLVFPEDEPFLIATKEDKWGFWKVLDNAGISEWYDIPFIYDYAYDFSEGLGAVKRDNKWGFVNKTGKEIIPLIYDAVQRFSEGLAAVNIKGKWGFIDKKNNKIIHFKYDNACQFSEDGLAIVTVNGKQGVIDKGGRELTPFKYDSVWEFSEGLAVVKLNDRYGAVDKTGKEVIAVKYDRDNWKYSEGLAKVIHNGKYGFIDRTGKEVIPTSYNDAKDFSEGLAAVRLNGKYGFIGQTGKEVIPLMYDEVKKFSKGLANVKLNGEYFNIDKTGKIVIVKKDKVEKISFDEIFTAFNLDNKMEDLGKTEIIDDPIINNLLKKSTKMQQKEKRNYLTQELETTDCYHTKVLCVLVLDVSGSMNISIEGKSIIDRLNNGLKVLTEEISNDIVMEKKLELSIIAFNDEVETVLEPSLIKNVKMPLLTAFGTTAMVDAMFEAIRKIEHRKEWYKSIGQKYHKPWIVLITDGEPDEGQDVEALAECIRNDINHKKYRFIPLGIKEANMEVLQQLCKECKIDGEKITPLPLNAAKFSSFFRWLVSHIRETVSEEIEIYVPENSKPVNSDDNWLNNFVKM